MGMRAEILIVLGLLVLLPSAVAVCCIDTIQEACDDTLNSCSECPAGEICTSDVDCNTVTECELGCCCDGQGGSIGGDNPEIKALCTLGNFVAEGDIGAACSDICQDQIPGYTVSGTVTDQNSAALVSATVSFSGLGSTITGSNGYYLKNNVPFGTYTITVSHPDCNETSDSFLVDQSLSNVDFSLSCDTSGGGTDPPGDPPGTCTPEELENKLILDSAVLNTGTNTVDLGWSINSTCDALGVGYAVLRSTDWQQPDYLWSLIGETDQFTFTDLGDAPPLLEDTVYYYKIQGHFAGQESVNSNVLYIRIGDAACEGHGQNEFCYGNDVAHCTLENGLQVVEYCTPRTCVQTQNDAYCRAQAPCEDCNRLYGMFSYLDELTVEYQNLQGFPVDVACQDLVSASYLVCYEDSSDTVSDPVKNCADVSTCGAYDAEDVCNLDPCNTNLRCSWREVYGNAQSDELGLGVCTAEGADSCMACNDLPGGCSPGKCESLGDCYYSDPECIAYEDVTCNDYIDINDCIGGVSVQVDAQYDGDGVRTGGDHSLVPSQDFVGKGKCYWYGSACYKNADGYANVPEYPDDCAGPLDPGYEKCSTDFTSPVTNFFVYGDGIVGQKIPINYYVSDNEYAGNEILTRYCFSNSLPCYPTTLAAGPVYFTGSGVGAYTIYYYSEDGQGHNLEEVQSLPINIDTLPPSISLEWGITSYPSGDVYRSDLELDIGVNDDSPTIVCSWQLNLDGTTVGSGADSTTETSDTFTDSFSSLADGNYGLLVTCQDVAKNEENVSVTIKVLGDTRLNNFLPNETVQNAQTLSLSVTTDYPGNCRYDATETSYSDMGTSFAVTGGLVHTAPMPTEVTVVNVYKYHIACLLETPTGTILVEDNPGHVILFALDNDAPTTTQVPEGVEIINNDVQLTCDDFNPDLIDGNNVDWKFDCDEIFLCEGVSCTPTGNGTDFVSLTLQEESIKTFRYYSKDLGGNTETTQEVKIIFDLTPPQFFNLTVEADPKYEDEDTTFTNISNIIIKGVVSDDTVDMNVSSDVLNFTNIYPTCDETHTEDFCIAADGSFEVEATLTGGDTETLNIITLSAVDYVGNFASIPLKIVMDTKGPDGPTFRLLNE